MRFSHTSRLLAVAVLLLSCTDPSGPRTPTTVDIVSGAGQRAMVGTALPERVAVQVRDEEGRILRGVRVDWTVVSGGGSVSTTSVITGITGRASVEWTLGTQTGTNRLRVSVEGLSPVTVTAAADAGAPATVGILSGNNQVGVASVGVPDVLRVRVTDVYGNAAPRVTVTFAADGGTLSPAAVETNVSGVAQTTWIPGPAAGRQSVMASSGGAPPVEFSATVQPAANLVELANDVALTGLAASAGARNYYRINVPANASTLAFAVSGGPGDADLFVRPGALPSTTTHECRSTSATASESCVIQAPAPGEWYVLLHAFNAYSDATLRASYQIGGSLGVTVAGLPQGAAAAVSVTGPSHYSRQLTGSANLGVLVPGSYTVTAYHVLADETVYAAEPDLQQINVTSGASATATVSYAATAGANLDITGAYITQSVQRPDGTVPLVAGRDGLVRVFARSNALNSDTPSVRVRVYQGGTIIDTRMIPAPAAAVPITSDEADLASTWNVQLPGSLIQPGISVLVDIDPANSVTETDESDNSYPATGTPLALDVRSAPPLRARLVPVLQEPNQHLGDVTAANADSYITKAEAIYPLSEIDVDVREPYTFSGVLGHAYDAEWSRLLNEMLLLRQMDGSDRYYYGVINPSYTFGGTGYGYIGDPAAIGVDWPPYRAETVAHEWGHNFGRRHVACGGPSGTDPGYPYMEPAGAIGHFGWDVRTGKIVDRSAYRDIMSYCSPTWASDYTYEAVLSFRAAEAAGAQAAEPSLIVWGRVAPDGVVLEPAFEVHTRPALPRGAGEYRLTGTSASGTTVIDIAFDGREIDHMPGTRHFAFAIPLRMLGGERPQELRLTGAGVDVVRRAVQPGADARAADVRVSRAAPGTVHVQWNAALTPALLVRDAATGAVLSIARGGSARIATGAAELEITASDGIGSTARRIVVSR